MMSVADTIAAISTGPGPSARMIVRVSGPAAREIVGRVADVGGAGGGRVLERRLRFEGLSAPGWVYVFLGPRSYTGEDLFELHMPGNPVLGRLMLRALFAAGARLAEPGEFTARAFFNGKIGLSEAEGVAAAVGARNEQELAAARRLMAGELARRLRPLTDAVAETLARVELGIDFSEEDVAALESAEVVARIEAANSGLRRLMDESGRFERLAHEPRFVLVGRPNAGKSTLLNALAGSARAMTSPLAGTTRDALTAVVSLAHGIVQVTDVAGLEEDAGDDVEGGPLAQVERQMRQRALRTLEEADYVLRVIDATDPRPPLVLSRTANLTVQTKADLLPTPSMRTSESAVSCSAVTGWNLDEIRSALDRLAFGSAEGGGPALSLNARHLSAIGEADSALGRARAAADEGAEVMALELREALDALGHIVGEFTPDDVLGRVFSAFCIGK